MRYRALAVVMLLFAPSVAHAQPRDRAAADALFQAARAEFERGEYASACEKFAESNRLDPAPGTLLNLSLCLEKVGKVASAWEGYRQVAEQLRDERVDFASKRFAALETRLPWVTVTLPEAAPSGTRVFRDGIELGSAALGVALPMDPGPHTLRVHSPGYLEAATDFTVDEGERKQVVANLGPKEPKPEPKRKAPVPIESNPPPPVEAPDQTFAWIAGGIGVAGITTSLVTGAVAISNRNTVRDRCVDRVCDDEGLDAASSGKTFATVSTITGVVGFAGLGLSTYLFLSEDREQTPSTKIEAATLPGGAYVGMTRRF